MQIASDKFIIYKIVPVTLSEQVITVHSHPSLVKVNTIKRVCRTKFLKGCVKNDEALNVFTILRDEITWTEGVRSKHGFTRKAKALNIEEYPLIKNLVTESLDKILPSDQKYMISDVYLNYYENGEMYTPNHSHPGSHQLVISLGGARILDVGKNQYLMENGDAILFGSAVHGVKKQNSAEPRISIATFMSPISNIDKHVFALV